MTITRRQPGGIASPERDRRIGGLMFHDLPLMIQPASLAWYYDTSKGRTINTTPDPDTVSRLADRSGNGLHLVQETEANQPEFTADNLSFTAAVEFLYNDSGSALVNPGTGDYSVIARMNGVSSAGPIALLATQESGGGGGWTMSVASSKLSVVLSSAVENKWYIGGANINDSAEHTIGFTWDNSADAFLLYVDGVVVASPSKFVDDTLIGDDLSGDNAITYGVAIDEANDWDGEGGAAVGYTTVLTAAEMLKLHNDFTR